MVNSTMQLISRYSFALTSPEINPYAINQQFNRGEGIKDILRADKFQREIGEKDTQVNLRWKMYTGDFERFAGKGLVGDAIKFCNS